MSTLLQLSTSAGDWNREAESIGNEMMMGNELNSTSSINEVINQTFVRLFVRAEMDGSIRVITLQEFEERHSICSFTFIFRG